MAKSGTVNMHDTVNMNDTHMAASTLQVSMGENDENLRPSEAFGAVVPEAGCEDRMSRQEFIRNVVETVHEAFAPDRTESRELIEGMCDSIKEMLLSKNRKYGDSALHPRRIVSRADAVEQLKVRIDDKLNRIANQQTDEDEDVWMDLAGYCVLMCIALKERGNGPAQ